MVRKPPLPKCNKPVAWKTPEEANDVKGLMKNLRKKWKWSCMGSYDPMQHVIDRTLIGLEIKTGTEVDSITGTVQRLRYFKPSDSIYCDLWVNSMQVEKNICLSSNAFFLTANGKKDWDSVLSGDTAPKMIELQSAPEGKDCWLDDTEIDGIFYTGQQETLKKEKMDPSTRDRNYFLVRSIAYQAAAKAVENGTEVDEEMELDYLVKEEGDDENRDRLIIPAGSGTHWSLLVVNIVNCSSTERHISVQVVDSLHPVADVDKGTRTFSVPGKVSYFLLKPCSAANNHLCFFSDADAKGDPQNAGYDLQAFEDGLSRGCKNLV